MNLPSGDRALATRTGPRGAAKAVLPYDDGTMDEKFWIKLLNDLWHTFDEAQFQHLVEVTIVEPPVPAD